MFRFLKSVFLVAILAMFASSANAKFLQPDWLDPTLPGVGTNRYSYSFNDPINLMDPTGNEVPVEEMDEDYETFWDRLEKANNGELSRDELVELQQDLENAYNNLKHAGDLSRGATSFFEGLYGCAAGGCSRELTRDIAQEFVTEYVENETFRNDINQQIKDFVSEHPMALVGRQAVPTLTNVYVVSRTPGMAPKVVAGATTQIGLNTAAGLGSLDREIQKRADQQGINIEDMKGMGLDDVSATIGLTTDDIVSIVLGGR